MSKFFILLLIATPLLLTAKETKKIVRVPYPAVTMTFYVLVSKANTIMTVLDRPPLFLGGTSRFNDYVADEIHIPLHKATEKVIGTVYISFTVDSLGRTSNHRILKEFGKMCNAEALRIMKTIPDEWIPGVFGGKYISVDYIVPFQFDPNMPIRDIYRVNSY
jgi:protein TonB